MIIQHIKRTKQEIAPKKKSILKRTHKIGTLIAFRNDKGTIRVGFSSVNVAAGDVFDAKKGILLAEQRTYTVSENGSLYIPEEIPRKIREKITYFVEHRCSRYFKQNIKIFFVKTKFKLQ